MADIVDLVRQLRRFDQVCGLLALACLRNVFVNAVAQGWGQAGVRNVSGVLTSLRTGCPFLCCHQDTRKLGLRFFALRCLWLLQLRGPPRPVVQGGGNLKTFANLFQFEEALFFCN